jgi:multidrug efflux pump subunit AcrB
MDPTVFPIIAYSLTSQTVPLTTLRDIGLFQLRPVLTGVPGVAQIGVTGGQDEEFQILVNPARLAAYGLSFDDVAKAVSSANVLSAVGRLEDHYKLFLVVSGRMGEPEEIADVALFLASPYARWVTGQILAVDGGENLLGL